MNNFPRKYFCSEYFTCLYFLLYPRLALISWYFEGEMKLHANLNIKISKILRPYDFLPLIIFHKFHSPSGKRGAEIGKTFEKCFREKPECTKRPKIYHSLAVSDVKHHQKKGESLMGQQ